jgi:hypothetical protein
MKHIDKTETSLKNNFYRRTKDGLNGFDSFQDFKSWYNDQEKTCYYCGLTEQESQRLVRFTLKSKRFPQNGKPGRGTARGMYLEVDRLKSGKDDKYSRENCVLACYFCNNDKSDVFDGIQYKHFYQDRANYLRSLMQK